MKTFLSLPAFFLLVCGLDFTGPKARALFA